MGSTFTSRAAINVIQRLGSDVFRYDMKLSESAQRKIINIIAAAKGEASKEAVTTEAYALQQQTFKQTTEFVSQKTKDAHTRLYKGYIDALNKTSAELDTATKVEANPNRYDFRSLKLDEARNANAVYLHELYFENCFDPRSEIHVDTKAYMRLERDFGDFSKWQADLLACALSAREGWVVTGYSVPLKRYVNVIIDEHSYGVMVGLIPVVVIDMWSHAYYKDYLDDKKSYVVAQMKELNWKVIESRFERTETIARVMR